MKTNAPIGIYDSGMGGLSVRREVCRLLPEESVIYLGDGKNCPYGSRSVEEIRQLSVEAVEHLLGLGCKLVVVACNTASALALVSSITSAVRSANSFLVFMCLPS